MKTMKWKIKFKQKKRMPEKKEKNKLKFNYVF